MSSASTKLSLLALISSAAAVPHYSHSRFHHRPSGAFGTGKPIYPTGVKNNTVAYPTGTGVEGESTSTIDETSYTTTTIVSTIYASKPGSKGPASSPVEAAEVPSGGASCGPATVYVTATNKVTVTVTPSSLAASSSASKEGGYHVSSVSFEIPTYTSEAPSSLYSSSFAAVDTSALLSTSSSTLSVAPSSLYSSSFAAEETSSILSLVNKPVDTPTTSSVKVGQTTSAAPSTSSAAPTSSSAPSHNGGKRGLAYNSADLCSAFSGKASWAYNWGSTPGGNLPEGIKYYPMSWFDRFGDSPEKWLGHVDDAVKNGADVVIGFNEPDHGAQANLTPQKACELWKKYMNPVASSHPAVTILGPSVTNAGNDPNMGLNWLQQFQDVCPDAIWHATNQHFYDIYQEGEGETSTLGRFQAIIEKAAKQTGKKVWVTEFGLNPGSASDEQAAKFLEGAIKYMDGSDKCGGYSYFMVGTGQYQLNSGSGLSTVGKVYGA